jgi:putative NADH-flavin reductase
VADGRFMNLAIIAATGGIGRQLVEQALAAGHVVTAVVRDSRRVSAPIRVFTTDLASPDVATIRSAIQGADAVLSALGARSASDVGVAVRGTRAVTQAMGATAVRRIVVVSAAPIGTVPSPRRPDPPKYDPGDGFFMRHLLAPVTKAVLRRHYADLARMEDTLIESAADWTIVRPPRLTNGALTGAYRVARRHNLRHGLSISRADVAHFMFRALDDPTTIGQIIGVAD